MAEAKDNSELLETKGPPQAVEGRTVLVTGANGGLGYDACRQFASLDGVTKILLGCRSQGKADAAIQSLVEDTGKPASMFGVVLIDVSDVQSSRQAVESVEGPIHSLVLNAGGSGSLGFADVLTDAGVLGIYALNVLGSVAFVDALFEAGKLPAGARIAYAGSEAARGAMGGKPAEFAEATVECLESHLSGTAFQDYDAGLMYAYAKGVGALCFGALAREHPAQFFLTISPGATMGTNLFHESPCCVRACLSCFSCCLVGSGRVHTVADGAGRYVDAVRDGGLQATYASGTFVASQKGLVGPLSDQSTIWPQVADQQLQDAALQAIRAHY